MIFISFSFADKPVVEPIALKLRALLGQEKVFFAPWSIQPGEGIIDRMNKGLQAPEFMFFFVSSKSLSSNMVKLEWQNALYQATNGTCRLIPVRVDETPLPAILAQSLYIDMFTIGIDAALAQIVKVVQGDVSYAASHADFSNLTWSVEGDPTKELLITIKASHLMEARPNFTFIFEQPKSDVFVWIKGSPGVKRDDQDFPHNGMTFSTVTCAPVSGEPITPNFPLVYTVKPLNGATVKLHNVLHEKRAGKFDAIPRSDKVLDGRSKILSGRYSFS